MANIEDCPGFETFGADVKAARSAKHLSRKTLAGIINIDSIAVFRNKAYIHRSETSLSSQKGKQSEKHVGLHSEEHPVS